MSFGARVALASAVAVAFAVLLLSLASYVLVRQELVGAVDSALESRALVIREGPRPGRFPDVPPPALGEAGGVVQVVGADGSVYRGRDDDDAEVLPATSGAVAVAAGTKGPFFEDVSVSGTDLRVLTVPLRPGLALQVARPLTEVDHVLGRLRWILLFVGLGGVGLAALLGLAVARTALAPVRTLTETAEEITSTADLARRVDVRSGDELGRLATSFNAMLGSLDESRQAQRRLVADASHELRTPLTSLRTNVELLGRGDLPDGEREAAARDAALQAEELSGLVSDLVELARDGERQLELEDLRLDQLVAEAVERARVHARSVTFTEDLRETYVRGDPGRLARAVGNVLDNAAKWSPERGNVEVCLAESEVTVRDHGPGIAEEDLAHVFDRFYRAPTARGRPGSGLGLAIVRQVVEAHGGTVVAEAAEGGGTLVRIDLSSAAFSTNS